MRSKPAEVVPNPNDVVQFGDISWGFGGLCFAADGNRIVGGHKSDGVSVFDVAGKSVLSITKLGEEYRRLGLCQFSQDGRLLLLSSDRGLVVCCQLDGNNRPKPISQFAGHSRGLSCMDLSKDGRIAATGDSDKRVRCWETKSGHQFGDVLTFERAPQAVRISPDGNRLWATDGKTVITYDLQQKEILDQRVLSGAGIGQASAISFDGALLASGDSYAVKLWDIRTGRPLPSMEAGEIQWSMQFMPNSKVLVSGGRNKLSFWDTDRQQRVAAEIFDDAGYIKVFAISPDGNLVAAHTRRNVVVRKIEVTK